MQNQKLVHFVGKEKEVEIEKVVLGGDGLSRLENGEVLMTPFVIPGEKVAVRIVRAAKKHLLGQLTKIIVPSGDRTEPPCPLFMRCGGCQYQHIKYPTQLKMKREQVIETIIRLGGFTAGDASGIVAEIEPSPYEYGYRNRIVLHWTGKGEWGYYALNNRTVMPVESCPIANEEVNRRIPSIKSIPVGPGRNEVVVFGISAERTNPATNEMSITICDKVFMFNNRCFTQTNLPVFESINKYILTRFSEGKHETLVELYCGIGVISIISAEHFKHVIAFDINSDNIGYARKNAERNKAGNIFFFANDSAEALRGAAKRGIKPDFVILDPPREGLSEDVITGLLTVAPANVLYISCDPATFTRDMKRLSGRYVLKSLKPFDMFPQTAHIEIVGELCLK